MERCRSIGSAITSSAILWLGVVLLIILSIAALLPVSPNDYWWYLRLGQDILITRSIPTTDTYSWTQFGQSFIYHSWLSAIIFWLALKAGGIGLTVLLRVVMVGVAYGILWHVCTLAGAGPRLSSLLVLAAALAGSSNWAIRPQIFSYPFFALTLLCLWHWQQGRSRWAWVLPVAVLVWVNLHGSYVLAFLLSGAALVAGEGDRKRLAIAMAAMLLATLINPRGLGAWGYVSQLISAPPVRDLATEWQPPTVGVWHNAVFFAWLLLFPALVHFSSGRLQYGHWLWYLGLGWLALSGVRSVIWAVTMFAPLTAILLSGTIVAHIDSNRSRGVPVVNVTLFALFVLMPLTLLPGVREKWWSQSPPALSPDTPVDAVAWLKDHPDLPGPLWSDLAFSSYLIFALPERPVWIDTRLELFPIEQWEHYQEIAKAAPDWESTLDEEGVNMIMLDPGEQPRLLEVLKRTDGWQEAYADPVAVIFIRTTAQSITP